MKFLRNLASETISHVIIYSAMGVFIFMKREIVIDAVKTLMSDVFTKVLVPALDPISKMLSKPVEDIAYAYYEGQNKIIDKKQAKSNMGTLLKEKYNLSPVQENVINTFNPKDLGYATRVSYIIKLSPDETQKELDKYNLA